MVAQLHPFHVTFVLALATCCLFAVADDGAVRIPAGDKPSTSEQPETSVEAPKRLREGAELVDEVGTFQATGDRITFYTSSGRSFRVLENLALDRIAATIDKPREWLVQARITEFRGNNYLLITRATLNSTSRSGSERARSAAPAGTDSSKASSAKADVTTTLPGPQAPKAVE